MRKETITYTDYNGLEKTEDFYFHFTEAELMELELTTHDGLVETMQQMVKSKDVPSIVSSVKNILLKAYGVKNPDGRRFIKSPELSTEFSHTPAYSILWMQIVQDDKKAAEFFTEVIPKAKQAAQTNENHPALKSVNN